ncbi:MAG: oligopeptide transporter, OPT family, partial [Deltaproteobacteria bacterium]|nr:oligopeptide transporter, OPT family [Deltaproteobacteria bacterium]
MGPDLAQPTAPEPSPMVPGEQAGPELSIRAVLLGVLLAAIFGAANAYLGLTAAMTVSTTFPAAVIAIAAFRLPFFRGGVLEQNIARTAATVGEALVAAGIFTLPAFVMIDLDGEHLWSSFNYWQSVAVLLIGGLLGIFFIIVMRRALTVDAKLPFPESYACYEIVKAGQGGQSGAAYVFGAMGMGLLLELLKNDRGLTLCQSVKEFLVNLPGVPVKLSFTSPAASPALLSVGYIIGPRYAAIAFSGGVLAWFVLIPLSLLLGHFPSDPAPDWSSLAFTAWRTQVRPIAVGAMLVGSFYTLWGLRGSLISALGGAFRSRKASAGAVGPLPRRERDLNLRLVLIVALLLALPSAALFYMWTHDWTGTLVATGLLMLLGFLLSVIGGWIVGLIGSSNQPVSGITLAGLIVTGVLLLALRVTGLAGVAASLGLAVMICTAASLSGTLIQELKVGQFLGATPWKMELAQILSTIAVAFVVIFPMILLHQSDIATGGTGIGGKALPAPQA